MALTGDQQYLWKSFSPSHFSFNFQYCDTEYRAVFKLPREPFLKTKSELDVRLDDRSVWCRSRKNNRRFFFPKSKENSIKSKESSRKKRQEVFTPSSKESSQEWRRTCSVNRFLWFSQIQHLFHRYSKYMMHICIIVNLPECYRASIFLSYYQKSHLFRNIFDVSSPSISPIFPE